MYTQLGVMTKGTVIEVNVSELGMVTAGGKVVFGKYAQITNNPENDGCINAVLRKSIIIIQSLWPSNCQSSCMISPTPTCTFVISPLSPSFHIRRGGIFDDMLSNLQSSV